MSTPPLENPEPTTYTPIDCVPKSTAALALQWDGTEAGAQWIIGHIEAIYGLGAAALCGPSELSASLWPMHITFDHEAMRSALYTGDWLIIDARTTRSVTDDYFRSHYALPDSGAPKLDVHALYNTTNAMTWAEEFCRLNPTMEPGTMVGWFANAMQTAESLYRRRTATHINVQQGYNVSAAAIKALNEAGINKGASNA